ncbi:MAG: hypothetical protein KF847_19595 [Pirellulales bacterium]|nr:hypothetical protein [Pirellulales bacterium]
MPLCPGDEPSPVYRLRVAGQDIPVALARLNGNFACHVAAVEIDAPQEIVLSAANVPLETMRIRPRRWKTSLTRRGEEGFFALRPNQKLAIESPGQKPLFLFALPPEASFPDPADPQVLYYGPGEHAPGEIRLRSGQHLYLAAGARVRATVYALEASNVSIRGRGVLDARGLTSCEKRTHGILFERCQDVAVEGIQLRTGDWWQSNFLLCDQVRINHLHTLSFGKNNDGVDIDGVTDFRIADSFLGCGDDGFGWHALDAVAFGEPPTRNCLAERCVIWNEYAGNGLRIGASMETGVFEKIMFRDIDVLHASRNAVMSDHSDWASVCNVLFERFDNDTPMPLARMVISKNGYSNKTGYRDARGTISQVVFRDSITSGEGAILHGAGPQHGITGIRFVNCFRKGAPFGPADILAGPHVHDVACDDSSFAAAPPSSAKEGTPVATPDELVIDDGDPGAEAFALGALRKIANPQAQGGACRMIDSLGWGRAAVYTPRIEGRYEVFVHWGAHRNVATKAPWTVHHQDGYSTTVLNQNDSPGWKRLGVHQFSGDSWVRLADPHYQISDGPVVADAVRFVRVR